MKRTPFRRAPISIEFTAGDSADGSLEGLWVLLRRINIGHLREIVALADATREGTSGEVIQLADKVGECLVDWNWCDTRTGEPVEATAPGAINTLDADVLMILTDRWQGALEGVPKDLGKESGPLPGSGASTTSPAPIPVTGTPGLSSALANLPTHSEYLASSGSTPDTR